MRVVTTRSTTRSGRWRAQLAEPDQFGVALLMILVTIGLLILVGDAALAGLGSALFVGLTLLFILVTSRARSRTIAIAATVTGAAIGLAALAALTGYADRSPYAVVNAMLAFVAPLVIARRLLGMATITLRTVAGALCLYLLIGVFFASVYTSLDGLAGPFFAQTDDPALGDFVYFSYITIATVGYGDLSPATPVGQMLAVTEALIGQLYLVAGVALVVGNIGRARRTNGSAPSDLVDDLRSLAPHGGSDR
jgi:hypothetical protein